ncbi:MAG: two-component regulator propeller domain-containing protein, partial [Flavobacteriaceae bacterium]|nr:two-component regulator propeller domain-containing protein [Flavobacteriaceae bacterium]
MKNRLSIVFSHKTLCLLAGVWFFISTNAQIPGLTQFTLNDGLTSNTIYDISQDSQGNMLFATDFGLSKFDGVNFKNYTIEDGLPDNEILRMFKDSKQRIWLFGFNGNIAYIKDQKIYNKSNTAFLKKFNFSSYIHDFHEDSNGNIWLLDANSNLLVLNYKDQIIKTSTVKNYTNKSQFYFIEDKFKKVNLITYDEKILIKSGSFSNNEDWTEFKISDFLSKDIESTRNKRTTLLRKEDFVSMKIFQRLLNKSNINQNNLLFKTYLFDNNYWVTGLNKGAFIFNKNQQLENPIPILKDYQTTRAFQDREKNIWVGTLSNGVILFPDNNTTSYNFENIIDNDLYTVDVLNNYILVGNSFGKIFVIKEKTLEHIKTINLTNNNFLDRARIGRIYNNEYYFLSSDNYIIINKELDIKKIINKDDLKGDFENQKSFKAISVKENLTLISNAGGIFKVDTKTKKTELVHKGRTTAVLQNQSDTTWFGSTNGLHFIYQNRVHKPELKGDFNSTIITDLENFNNGILIASNSKGLGFLKNGKLSIINRHSGLLSNSIKSVFIAPNNDLWISTNLGLNRVKVDEAFNPISIESYTISEGLNTNDVRNCFVTEHYAYVATSKGLNIIDLKSKKRLISTPTVHIKEIILNNTMIPLDDNQSFSSSNNNIQFNYSGISFKSIGNISFKYRLIGLEKDWIDTKNNSVRYSTLPYGNYTFELKSITKNGIESSKIYQYSFKIKRPFYHTWFFRIIVIIIIFSGLYAWYLTRKKREKREKEIDEKISNLRFKALNAQMNPHFINNLLTMIIDLISKGKKEKAVSYLFSFSNLV